LRIRAQSVYDGPSEKTMEDIARGVRSFSIGTAISRVLGLVRESVFAWLFGAGRSTDAFVAAFRIPNLLRDLFAETALSAAFVPVLASEKAKGKEDQNRFASNVLNVLFLAAGLVSIAGVFLSPQLARLIAVGFGGVPEKIELTARLTAIVFPFLLFIALAAWAMSYLNTEGSFFLPSLAPAFFNLASIAVPVGLYGWFVRRGGDPIYGMAIGVVAGGLMQFLVQIPGLRRKGFRFRPVIDFRDPALRRALALFIPVAVGLAASRINITVSTVLVSLLEEKSMTWLNYAFRVMHLPLGLFGIAVGTVALPRLSRLAGEGRLEEIRETVTDSLKMVFVMTIPAAAVMAFLASPITRLIYERGKFTPLDTAATAQALVLYLLGIPFMSALRNAAAAFYAWKDARTPMRAGLASIAANIVLNLILMRPLGFLAFPLSATIAAVLNLGILMALLPRKIGPTDWGPLAGFCLRTTAAAAAGGAVGWFLNTELARIPGPAFLSSLLGVVLAGAAALAVFYAAGRLLGLREIRDYIVRFLK
jgi:putative peptidoglycan lipid II flippase